MRSDQRGADEIAPIATDPGAFSPQALIRKARRGEPTPARVIRVSRGLLNGANAARDVAAAVTAVQQPVTTGLRIAVVGVRGGAGTSTVASLLSLTYGRLRNDPILLVDLDPVGGVVAWRLGAASQPSFEAVHDTLRSSHGGYDSFPLGEVPRGTAGVRLLGSQAGADPNDPAGRRFGAEVLPSLTRHFAVTVIDTVRGVAPAQDAVRQSAHAVVVVVPVAAEGIYRAERMLAQLTSSGTATPARHVIAAMVSLSPAADDVRLSRATASLRHYADTIVELPFDRHLGSGGLIDPSLIAEPTDEAARSLAGRALDTAMARAVRR